VVAVSSVESSKGWVWCNVLEKRQDVKVVKRDKKKNEIEAFSRAEIDPQMFL
jgi:hypothetical protein